MKERNFKPSKRLLDIVTMNGLRYYQLIFPNLKQKDEKTFHNTINSLRGESNPSLQIYVNPSTNKWLFKDWGDPYYKGDMYDLAAMRYDLVIKSQFVEVMEKIYDDLQIDSFVKEVIEKCLKDYDTSMLDFSHIIPHPAITNVKNHQPIQKSKKFLLLEYSFDDLLPAHKAWLDKYGIKTDDMEEHGAVFLKGYTIINENESKSNKEYKPASDQIWIGYKFPGGCKIYCPDPKAFWYIGQFSKGYIFGTLALDPRFKKEEIVILAAGEKDVLVLLSKYYYAFCLSSETKNISQSTVKDWYFENHCTIIVAYDKDETGVKQAMHLNETVGVKYITWPQRLSDAGGKDVSDFFRLGGTTEEFNFLIQNAISNNDKHIEIECVPIPIQSEVGQKYSVRTAMQRIKDATSQKDILPLFGVLTQTNELVILFGDTGIGKSIMAVSIANAISKGEGLLGLQNCNPPMKVLFLDFELSDKQFQKRYTNDKGEAYQFSDNFYIDNIDFSSLYEIDKKIKFEQKLLQDIEKKVSEVNAEFVVVDNITFLSTQSAEDGQIALTIMKLLKDLKTKSGITVLVLAHTPKQFEGRQMSLKDLAGSKHISNFADGVFALGSSSSDKAVKYLKQVKPSRSAELIYDSSNVLVCELSKENSFLTFIHKGFKKESELHSSKSEDEKIEEAIKLKVEGKTYKEIADILLTSKSTVGRWLKDK